MTHNSPYRRYNFYTVEKYEIYLQGTVIFLISASEIKSALANEKGKSFICSAKKIIYILLHFALGVLMGGINSLGAFSPFGVAIVTAVKPYYLIPCAVGAATGSIFSQDSVTALRYLAAIVGATVTIRLLRDSEKVKKFRLIPSFVSFGALLLTSAVMLVARPSDFRAFMIFFGEAVLGFACSYFFSSAIGAFELYTKQGGFSVRDIAYISLSLFTLLLSLEDISVFSLSVSRIIAAFFVLLMSYIYKESGGVLSAVASTLIFSMSRDVGVLGVISSASGFASGVFSYMGKYVISASYFFTYLIMFILNSDTYSEANLVAESFIACVAFCLVKDSALERISNMLSIRREPETAEIHRKLVLDKLRSTSRAIEGMTNSISAASGLLRYNDSEDGISVYSQIRENVCENCRHRELCWEKNFDDCKKAFDEMSEILRNCGMVNRSNMPKYLSGCCVNSEKLTDVFNRGYLNYISAQANQNKIEKIRQITAEQFSSVYTVLGEASEPLEKGVRFDAVIAQRVEEMLINRFSVKAQSVLCLVDENNKLRLEITFLEKPEKIRESDFRPSLEQICETNFDKPVLFENGKTVTLCICQKTEYRVEVAAARIVADSEKHCGDNFESFYDGKGNYTVILSDGMGTGMRACVDSSLAVSVSGRLLRAGFNYDSAVRLTNCAMLLKSVEESLATLDIMKINLYTGQTEFYKAGAAVSYIKKNEKVIEIRQPSMPIGILSEVNFSVCQEKMTQGNIALLASDGAFEHSDVAVKNSLAVALDERVEEIAERSAARAKKAGKGKRGDDITVVAVRLVKNR